MEKLNLKKCDSLADVFCAVLGGKTSDIREIKDFIEKSPLKSLIYANDMERILQFDGFFADEVVDAVYALLPVKLRLSPELSWVMTPQAFRKLNAAQVAKPASRYINVSLSAAFEVYAKQYHRKLEQVVKVIQEEKALGKNPLEPFEDKYIPPYQSRTAFLAPQKEAEEKELDAEDKKQQKHAKQREQEYQRRRKELKKTKSTKTAQPETTHKSVQPQPTNKAIKKKVKADTPRKALKDKQEEKSKVVPNKKMTLPEIIDRLEQIKKLRALKTTPEKIRKELKKEANRLQTAKYRLENPDAWKKSYKKMSDLPPEKQAKRRAANNRRNDTFRSIHREELRVYHNNLRAKEKAENPEAVREKDKKHNSSAEAKAAKKRYYEKNTQQVIERAIRHNKIKRFKQKTGPVILGLLQGIINSKIK